MDVGGLGAKWEAENGIRDRIRKDRKLCLHPLSQRYCEPTRPNAISNAMVLRPALQILRDTKGWKLPHIEPLQAEIFQLFQRVGVEERRGILEHPCGGPVRLYVLHGGEEAARLREKALHQT